ncbi:MAG TPA: MBL fold metallo-hydrolase, partial [Armatimonadota bacterium]|nr:MBL fold metallo-hydrolase [Armatimonadota bacterium]
MVAAGADGRARSGGGRIAAGLPGVTGVDTMLERLHWLGHDAFRISGATTIYLDPFQLEPGPPADLILLTHPHRDHCSPDDLAKIAGPQTLLVGTADTLAPLSGARRTIAVGETLTFGTVTVEAVPAYNLDKPFHPKASGWVGYLVTVEGARIYHAGDTDRIPEMKAIRADIALLPVGGTYTMTAAEAALAARDIAPKLAIPMHYGAVVGTDADARRFA